MKTKSIKKSARAKKRPKTARAAPGDRSRHFLTEAEVAKFIQVAGRAASYRQLKSRAAKSKRLKALLKYSRLAHETLLKWGILYKAFGADQLRELLVKHGKSKLYVLAYHKDPAKALREGVPDPDGGSAVVRLTKKTSAEKLRLAIRANQQNRKGGGWFRNRTLTEALPAVLRQLQDEFHRIEHRVKAEAKASDFDEDERKALHTFRDGLSDVLDKTLALLKMRNRPAG